MWEHTRGTAMRKVFSLVPALIILIACHTQSVDLSPTHQVTYSGLQPKRTTGQLEAITIDDDPWTNVSLCPSNMIEVQGNYCPVVQQRCLYMVDNKGNKTDELPSTEGRCGEFANPVRCVAAMVHKHFCIDKYELPNIEGAIPLDWLSWYDVKKVCESQSKRMCTHSEWSFAAEGPSMHPYPYGDGFHRDRVACNFDNRLSQLEPTFGKVTGDDVLHVSKLDSAVGQALHSLLVPSGSNPQCVSEWGVHDMPGNIDEWVINESGKPFQSGLVGGHVFGVRNASRPMTEAHGPDFSWYETGGRCCQDPNE